MVPTRTLPRALSSPLCLVLNTPGPLFPPIWPSMHSPTPSAMIVVRFLGPDGTLRSLKTTLAPTREHDLSKIEGFISNCFRNLFLPVWGTLKSLTDVLKTPQIAPRRPKDATKTIPRRPQILQDLPKTVLEASKEPRRPPQDIPRPSRDPPKTVQDSLKSLPTAYQDSTRPPQPSF